MRHLPSIFWIYLYNKPVLSFLYRIFKCFYRHLSCTSEVHRILCLPDQSYRLFRLDNAIYHSKELKNEKLQLNQPECSINAIKHQISKKKNIEIYLQETLHNALLSIYDTYKLKNQISSCVLIHYDVNNYQHEKKLLELWNLMKPHESLASRVSSQWIQIGFQGTDPATDFRGMGIQGLNDLLYFAKHYPDIVHSILQHANHPHYWYPYAIVGINLSKFLYTLLDSRKLQACLFQYSIAYQEIYCYLFYRFDCFWQSTVMEFETKFKEFQFIIEKELEDKKPMRIQDNLQIYKRKE